MFQEMTVTGKYLLIPVRNQGTMQTAVFSAAGDAPQIPLNFIPGTRSDCDFVASYPLHFFGKTLRIEAENTDWIAELTQSETPAAVPFDLPERPQIHYSPNTGWLNDPNGLYYYEGLWHMYHQYNPLSNQWENMHWYHAVSEDLIHWRELGCAIPPLPCGTAYSGGTVIDWKNTSKLQTDPAHPPILLFYTAHLKNAHTQRIVFSTDGGKTFRQYAQNPIIPTIGDGGDRDPSVAWDPEQNEWLMALYLGDSKREFALLRSDNLTDWQEIQRFFMPDQGRECPELLRMQDEADGVFRWVIFEANGNYLVWERRQNAIHPVSQGKFLQCGKDTHAYACQTFKNTPDNTVTGIGWIRSKIRHAAFSQSMTLPFQLRLSGGVLCTAPHPAVEMLRKETFVWDNPALDFTAPVNHDLLELEVTLPENGDLQLSLHGVPLTFCAANGSLQLGENTFSIPENARNFRIFLDRTSVEIYEASGRFWCAQDLDWDSALPPVKLLSAAPHLRICTLRSIY